VRSLPRLRRSFLHHDGEPVGPALFEPVVTPRLSKAAVVMRQERAKFIKARGAFTSSER
jgi:hypothetical protein